MKRKNQTIVITGASSGIGRATAHEYARGGARIGLLARNEVGLEACQREVAELGGRGVVIKTDVSDAEQVEHAAERVEQEFGPIDVWINNAAVTVFAPLWETTPEEYRRVMEVNYLGAVHGSLSAVKRMRPRNKGSIVLVGSALAYRGIPLHAAYCASQHAILGFYDSLRTELLHEKSRVKVSLVEPAGVNTPLWKHLRSHVARQPRPLGTIYQPEVIARAIVYAADSGRREIIVGLPALTAILGHRYAPALADAYLGRFGVKSQFAGEEGSFDTSAPGNVFDVPHNDPGVHGPFDDRALSFSPQAWATTHRKWLAAALGAAALAGAFVATDRK